MSQTLFICPRCQFRALRDPNSGDFIHTCQNVDALQNESILVTGPWTDYTGSDPNVFNALAKGTENTLQGTRAGIEGDKFYPRDQRGFPINRFRKRQHLEYLETEFFDNKANSQVPHNPEAYEDYNN